MSLEIWVPPSADIRWTRCRVPTRDGHCGKRFRADQPDAMRRHVEACVRYHEEEIHDQSPVTKHPAFYAPWDVELEEFVARTGRI